MTTQNRGQWLVAASVMLATIIQVLDTTIANVALPHMQGSLGASSDQVIWILSSYIVATAIMTLPVGYLARRFGRRNVLMYCVAGFTAASMFCGQASSLTEMVVWRVVQGGFGAALVPLSQSILLDTFPREKHASAMSLWGMGVMIGPILGPTLGGWLTESYSWRWVFYINVPLGMLSLLGIYRYLPATVTVNKRFDLMGFGLLALAVGALQLLLDRGEHLLWFDAMEIKVYAVLVALGLYLFLVHSRTTRLQLLSPSLFRDRNFVTGLMFIFLVGIVLLSTMALLPPFLQNWKGYPVMTTGLILMPRGVGTMLGMLLVARLMRRFDPRALMLLGMALVCLSLYHMAGFTMEVGERQLIITGFIQGLGLGLVFIPSTTLAYATLPATLRDEGAALYSLSRNLGSSIGVSIMMGLFTRNLWINQQELASRLRPESALLTGLADPVSVGGLPATVVTEVSRQAAEIAFANDFHLLMWVNLATMPLVLLLRVPRAVGGGADNVPTRAPESRQSANRESPSQL
ncbi:DHA2 family efflux MFS transporter permease subunit [Haliea sp. E1-2-M8]|uniref:DHA2 family efflux MFS transporter permease subunit n=1 Tax=Haliea sp. E1-2-M8 TaxID=3064706 RepID=UPI00271BB22F|nr:DHA2 family efflux MFS transporter permease subunit [Haliea sp. E1-2-M8]MDO8860374.1 DHA2 family efflux MFS transporter permease subunit [Haliea sp. E1-2-M8]